jgi:hypothetical protein
MQSGSWSYWAEVAAVTAPKHRPVGSQPARYLAILVGVIVGYLVGRLLEDRIAWENARMLTMPVGGLAAGIIARFTFFREPPNTSSARRS